MQKHETSADSAPKSDYGFFDALDEDGVLKANRFRPQYTKFGCRDYRGAHCVLKINGRELLGEIVTMYRDETRGCVHAKVRHMNGDAWPVEPVMSQLWILDRSAS